MVCVCLGGWGCSHLNVILNWSTESSCCQVASVLSDSVQPHRRQPIRLPRPWDSPGKNTRVGCHFLLQRMKVKSESEVAQSCPNLRDPMDCSLPSSSIHGIFPGKSTKVGCHCLLPSLCRQEESAAPQSKGSEIPVLAGENIISLPGVASS